MSVSDCQLPQKMNDINEIERGEEGKKGGIDFKRQALRTTYKCLLCPKGAPPYVKAKITGWHKHYRRRWSVARSGRMQGRRCNNAARGDTKPISAPFSSSHPT